MVFVVDFEYPEFFVNLADKSKFMRVTVAVQKEGRYPQKWPILTVACQILGRYQHESKFGFPVEIQIKGILFLTFLFRAL